MSKKQLVDLKGEIQHQTIKAWLFRPEDSDKAVWLAKSQCEWDDQDSTMTMPEWLAIEKELV